VVLGVLLSGCQPALPTVGAPVPTPAAGTSVPLQTPSPTSPAATPSTATPAATTPPSTPTTTPTVDPTPPATPTEPPKDTRKGAELASPWVVDGIPLVSRKHRVSAAYGPRHPTGPYGLERKVNTALRKLTAAAAADGVRIVVRSGYRSYATQASIYRHQLATYPSRELAKRYNAPAGASEHQTGLSLDLWDGTTWGLGMARTKAGVWLWKHSREYGFILRYPPGTKQEKITGYTYEPWHFRWIGERALDFKPNSRRTLEQNLGLA
jgi:D-alanyl-D-alanine carboxypeptidase